MSTPPTDFEKLLKKVCRWGRRNAVEMAYKSDDYNTSESETHF